MQLPEIMDHLNQILVNKGTRTTFLVPLPDGSTSKDWPPGIERIMRPSLRFQNEELKKKASRVISEIGKFRQKYGTASDRKIARIINSIDVTFEEESGEVSPRIRFDLPVRSLTPAEGNIAHRYKELCYALFDTNYINCPTSFCYDPDYFDLSGLDKIISEEKIRPDEKNKHALRTSNFEKRSQDKLHKISAGYFMGKDQGIFYVEPKYVAFGLKNPDGERDKMDLVFRIKEGQTLGEIRHVEINIPVLKRLYIDGIKETEGVGLIRDFADAKESKEQSVGYQIKTNAKGEKFGNRFLEASASRDMDSEEIKMFATNYQQLIRDPAILGGCTFDAVIKHARDNLPHLKAVYERKMMQKR